MTTPHTIPLPALELALFSAKLRRRSHGGTAQLCAVTAAPVLALECGRSGSRPSWRAECKRLGLGSVHTTPLQRGHIQDLVQRVRLHHGLAEVRRTWGCGLKEMLAEPAHMLNGGVRP